MLTHFTDPRRARIFCADARTAKQCTLWALTRKQIASLLRRYDAPLRERALWQLRHSALTHAAEDATNTPILLARSRHASVRSLQRYARPGPEAVARHVAEHDPVHRRR
jgi:hypothetical protein